MRKIIFIFLFFVIAPQAFADSVGTSVPVREEMVFLPLTHNLKDSTGELTTSSFSRASGSTRINPDTGLLEELHGQYSQLIDTTTGINPTNTDSWWEHNDISITSSGGLLSNTSEVVHSIAKTLSNTSSTVFCFSVKAKAGSVSFIRLREYDAQNGSSHVYFNINNGTVTSTSGDDILYSSISSEDSDGYYRVNVIFYLPIIANNRWYIYPAVSDSTSTYSGNGTNPDIYIKEINLVELPSSYSLSQELVTNGDFSTDTDWDKNNGWSISGGQAVYVSDGTDSSLTQSNILEYGAFYLLEYTVVSNTLSGLFRYPNYYGGVIDLPDLVGSHSIIIRQSLSNDDLVFRCVGNTVSTGIVIDDVSVKKLPSALVSDYDSGWKISSPPFTSTDTVPAEPAFEENGLRFMGGSVVNLLPYSEDFGEWLLQTNAVVTPGFLGPDGKYTAYKYSLLDTSSRAVYSQSGLNGSAGESYTVSIFVKSDVLRSLWLGISAFSGNTNISSTTISIPGDSAWHRYSYTAVLESDYNDLGLKVYELSGTGDRFYIFGANLTETAYLAPYIPSHGAQTILAAESLSWTMTDAFKNILSTSVGDSTAIGTLIFDWFPGYDYDDDTLGAYDGIVSVRENPLSIAYMGGGASNHSAYSIEGSTYVGINFDKDDYEVWAITWSTITGNFVVGVKNKGSWMFDSTPVTGFSSGFNLGTDLLIGYSNPYPFHIKNLGFFRRALSTDIIEANY